MKNGIINVGRENFIFLLLYVVGGLVVVGRFSNGRKAARVHGLLHFHDFQRRTWFITSLMKGIKQLDHGWSLGKNRVRATGALHSLCVACLAFAFLFFTFSQFSGGAFSSNAIRSAFLD